MIRNILLLIPFLMLLIIYLLQEGVSMDSLKIGNFKIKGLYLKLDNKLTLKVNELYIPKEHSGEGLDNIEDDLNSVKNILNYFEYIELDSVKYINDEYRVIYADDTIYINNSSYEIAGVLFPKKGGVEAEIPLLYIKKYNFRLHGTVTYRYENEKLTFDGNYRVENIRGKIKLETAKGIVRFWIDSEKTHNISRVLDRFDLPQNIRVWIDKKIEAEKYKLVSFLGSGILDEDGFRLDMNRTEARLQLYKADIKFHPNLKIVKSSKVTVRLHDNRLDFDLYKPLYGTKSLEGSRVALLNLTGSGEKRLLLGLRLDARYDKDIIKILETYGINIPLKQTNGSMNADIKLDIDLLSKKVKTEGLVLLSKGEIVLGGVPLKTRGGEVAFTSKKVVLRALDVYGSQYRGIVDGTIDIAASKANLEIDLNRLNIGSDKGVSLQIKNRKDLAVNLDFKDSIKIDIPRYKLKMNIGKRGELNISCRDIKNLLPHIRNFPIRIEGGSFALGTKDGKKYNFSGNAIWKQSYIYDKKGYISRIPFEGNYNNKNFVIKALEGRFVYDSRRSHIKIKNINIDAKKMIEIYASKSMQSDPASKLTIEGSNSIIRYGKHVLLTDNFTLELHGKNRLFKAYKDGDMVRVELNGNSLVVHAKEIKDRMLAALINFSGLRGGRYSLELVGNMDGVMKGVVDIKGGAVESFKAYNDLIALFNTVPALMTLSDPGFSKKGYVVKDGKIEFRIVSDRLILDTVYINGSSSTIVGKGAVELSSGKLNIDLAVRTAREMGRVLGKLPIVGYILFGEDKSATIGVKITGTLGKPKVKTNPVQEALLYPFELIKRTVTSPAHIINQ